MQSQLLPPTTARTGAVEIPGEDELRCRIINHLRDSGQTSEVTHLWVGYVAALLEWGLIDHRIYVGLCRLFTCVRDDELYHLFADAPMPPVVGSTDGSVGNDGPLQWPANRQGSG